MTNPNLTPESISQRLRLLTDKFEKHRIYYLSDDYSEAQAREDFIDPFFEALGWDIRNTAALSRRERDVIIEKGETSGRPDYNFRIDGKTKFFVEAKPPHDPLSNPDAILQAKSYAWSSPDVFVVLLTDFQELTLFDATMKPDRRHPDAGLIFRYEYTDYLSPKPLADIMLLSKQSVSSGSIDNLLKMSSVKAREKIPVDRAFLEDLSSWRELLAKSLRGIDRTLDTYDLNNIVQVMLDRLIFIRIAEDRSVLPKRGLEDVLRAWDLSRKRRSLTSDLNALFHEINAHLNGEIFKPHPCEKIDWDQDANLVADIVRNLYPPLSPYRFDAIGVEILGAIYEQYLGKTIRLTPTRAIVEDKPEVKKAGGIYYTPKHIVDYIVARTVSDQIAGKTPNQLAEFRILDPACGSGSFLIGAFQALLDHHSDYYSTKASSAHRHATQPSLLSPHDGGDFSLSLEQKASILRNSIFGVDIDPQAVEITMMSLYIKLLEGEAGAIAGQSLLPPLHDNIRCGNSIIGADYLFKSPPPESEDIRRVNPFDWTSGFRILGDPPRFNAIIGNPPYIKEYVNHMPFHDLQGTDLYKYYQGKMDIWYIFASHAIDLLKPRGLHSFIATNNWITSTGASILRNKILATATILEFTDFGDFRVFQKAGIQTMIYVLQKRKPTPEPKVPYRRITDPSISDKQLVDFLFHNITGSFAISYNAQVDVSDKLSTISFVDDTDANLLRKIEAAGTMRLDSSEVAQGIIAPQESVLRSHLPSITDPSVDHGDGIFVITDKELKRLKLDNHEMSVMKPFYTTTQLDRFYGDPANTSWIVYTDRATVLKIHSYPKIQAHLHRFSKVMTSDNKPYGLHRARNQEFFVGEKIVALRKTNRPHFTFTDFPCYVSQTFNVIKPRHLNAKYLTALLNSRVCHYWLDRRGKKQGDALQIDRDPLTNFPIRSLDPSSPVDAEILDSIIAVVDRIISLKQKLRATRSPSNIDLLTSQIELLEGQVDQQVFSLYGLDAEEIRTVQEATPLAAHG